MASKLDFNKMSDEELMSLIGEQDSTQPQTIQSNQPMEQAQPSQPTQPTQGSNKFESMSDEELMGLIGGQQPQGNGFVQDFDMPELGKPKSPLNPIQEAISGMAGNNKELTMDYIRKQLPGSKVILDENNEITIDGARYNPEGFDFGDITRNISKLLPLGGQVFGSITGGAATGGATMGVGTIPGAMIGGTAGAVTGRTAQLALGDFLGLDVDGRDYLQAMGDEAKIALTGEIAGAGLLMAGKGVGALAKPLSKTKIAKGAANFTKNMIKKAKGFAPATMQYIFQAPEEATNYTLNKSLNFGQNVDELFRAKYFSEDFSLLESVKMIFGKNIPVKEYTNFIDNVNKKHSNALTALAENIKNNINDPSTLTFLKSLGLELSDDTVGVVGKAGSSVLTPKNINPNRSIEIADGILNFVEKNQTEIGTALGSQRTNMIKAAGPNTKVDVSSLVDRLNSVTNELSRPIVENGKPITIKGLDKLREIVDTLTPKGKNIPIYGADGKVLFTSSPQAVKQLSLEAVDRLDRNVMDIIADEIFDNKNISGKVKGEFGEILKGFRSKVDESLGIKGLNEQYSMFKDLITDAKFNRATPKVNLDKIVRNFPNETQLTKNSLNNVLMARNQNIGAGIQKELADYTAAQELLNLDSKLSKSVTSLFNDIETKSFLKKQAVDPIEILLKTVSEKSINPALKNSYREILNRQNAKIWNVGGSNVFRAGSILNQLGGGGILGGLLFGVPGAIGGVGIASQLNPRGGKRLINFLTKGKDMASASKAVGNKVVTERNKALVRALLGRTLNRDNTQQ